MTLLAPQVGPYRILERLGVGGMGEVFLAEDTRLGRRVALKTLSGSGERPKEARHKLLREARAAAHLNHPNIAAVYDVIDSGEDAHIVMEYVAGETLAAIVQRGPLPVPAAVDIGLQLADAVAEAHAFGIVHRDLKPANVCVTATGRVKILDFGLAQSQTFDLSESTGPLETGTAQKPIVGTPQYIPPEHLLGGAADERGDVYSLGVTLFELLTGTRPFGGVDLVSLVSEVLHAPTPRVSERRREVTPRLDAVVSRAMARLPAERFASARELHTELRLVADEITHPDVSSVVVLPARPPVSRPSRLVAAGGLVLVAAVAGGAWWASARTAAAVTKAPVVVAVLPFASGAPGLDPEALGAGVSDVLTTTLARVPGIAVIARSVIAEEPRASVAAARKLGATHVVDGRIQGSGERLRISAQLVDVATSGVVWAGTYEGNRRDVLELERGLAEELTRAIAPGAHLAVPDRPPTADREAFADFSQGWSFLDRPDVPENADRAATAFRRAIARDPRFARAHAGLGLALLRSYHATRKPADADTSRAALTEALRLDPTDGSVRLTLAALYGATARLDDALEELARALEANPAHDEVLAYRGELLAEKGNVAGGIDSLREAIRVRPDLWRHHLRLGTVLFTASRYAEALPAFRRATELQPDAAWGFQMLGTTHHILGDLPAAIAAYKQAVNVGADAKAWDNLGTAYYQLARWQDALDAYQKAVELDPRSAIAWQNVGDLQRRLGRAGDSRRAYEQSLALVHEDLAAQPLDARQAAVAALVLAKLGRFAESRARAVDAVSKAPRQGDVLHLAAAAHALAGETPLSLSLLDRAVSAGYSRAALREDEFLSALRKEPRFVALVTDPPDQGGQP